MSPDTSSTRRCCRSASTHCETLPAAAAVDQYAFDEDLKRPRTYRWHLGLDREIGRANRLDVAYVGSAARELVYRAAYLPPLVSAPISIFSNEASADYHALLAQYTRRVTRGFGGDVSYAWSHAIDTDSGEEQLRNLPSATIADSHQPCVGGLRPQTCPTSRWFLRTVRASLDSTCAFVRERLASRRRGQW